jgi:CRP-like cAMP-binding protein
MDRMTTENRAKPARHPVEDQPPPVARRHDVKNRGTAQAANTPSGSNDCAPGQGQLFSLFETTGFRRHFQPDSTILLHGEAADAIFLVESGTVRCCTIDDQGRRQIFNFANKGAFVGISDFDWWHFTADAVDYVIVKSVPRAALEQELAVNIPLRQEIRAYMRTLLARREEQLLTLVNGTGPDRLYRFLQGFAATRRSTGYVTLPMCRRDIGDHIGLSTESVSRAFSHLKREGLIDLKSSEKYKIAVRSGAPSVRNAMPMHA